MSTFSSFISMEQFSAVFQCFDVLLISTHLTQSTYGYDINFDRRQLAYGFLRCADGLFPDVFAHVAKFVPWIKEQTGL